MGCSRRDPLYLDAAEVLDRMWHELPPAIPPIPIPGLQGHTESTTYYCGNKILYRWYDALPQLMLIDGKECLNLPVDQDFVRVFREGGHLTFSIAEPEEEMHAIFRPFVLAALKTRPKTACLDPPRRDRLCSLASLDLVRKHSSLTPVEKSKNKWVESDKALAKKMVATVADAARSSSLRVLARPITVLSSSTGFSQYFQGPSLSTAASSPEHKDLFALFRAHVPRYLLTDESRERAAAHHYWTILHPLQLARDLATVVDSTVFSVKQEGIRSLPLTDLLHGVQGAVLLSFDHLEDVCARSLTKVIQAKVHIREFMLGSLTPHTLCDPLLHSDLLQPDIFAREALDAAIPVFKAAVDARTIRDHTGRLPFHAPHHVSRRVGSPCRRFQRTDTSGCTWSQHPVTSAGNNQTNSFLQGGSRGAVLADLQRQVADLKAQLHAPVSGPNSRSRSCGSDRRENRFERRGRVFFRGNAGRFRGRACSRREKGSTTGIPTSAASRGFQGGRRF